MSLADLQDYRAYSLLPSKYELENPLLNFSRSSGRKVWNPKGFTENVSANEMGYSWNPATGLYEGRPISGQFTNQVKDPRDMTTGNWGGSVTVTRDQVGIDGQLNTACLVQDDDAGSQERVFQNMSIADDNSTHTVSLFIKKDNDESRFPLISIRIQGGSAVDNQIRFNTKTGQKDLRTGTDTFTVNDVGEFWHIWGTATNNNSGNVAIFANIYPAWSSSFTSDSNTTGSTIFDCAQVYLNTSTPPPLPVYDDSVSGQAVTKDPDIATITDLSSFYNPNESTVFVEFNPYENPTSGQNIAFQFVSDINPDGSYELRVNGGQIKNTVRAGSFATQFEDTIPFEQSTIKTAIALKENDFASSFNGSISTGSGTWVGDIITKAGIGKLGNSTSYLNGFIKSLIYYPKRLPNELLQQLTS